MSEDKPPRMNTITIPRKELALLSEVFQQASVVTRADTEDRTLYQRFKYYCGRNKDRVDVAFKHAVDGCGKINERYMTEAAADDEIAAYMAEQDIVLKAHAKKDDKGEPMIAENGAWDVPAEDHKAVSAELKPIKKKYAKAVKRQEQRNADLKAEDTAYMDQKVELRLFTVPWDTVPERIGGGYLVRLTPMLTGMPEDDPEEVVAQKCGPFNPELPQIWELPAMITEQEIKAFVASSVPRQYHDCVAVTVDQNTKNRVVRYTPEVD